MRDRDVEIRRRQTHRCAVMIHLHKEPDSIVLTCFRLGFVGETATFIAECAEDENDSVVREVHKLKNAVESVAGSISGL